MKLGLVTGLNRPGGNATGVSLLAFTLIAKELELLCELVPTAATVAFLVNPNNSNTVNRTTEMQQTARAVGRQLYVATAGTEAELEATFAAAQRNAGALCVPPDPFFISRREQLVALAADLRVKVAKPLHSLQVLSLLPKVALQIELCGVEQEEMNRCVEP